MDLNYNPKTEQIQILSKIGRGGLTPIGNIAVIKSLTLSRITPLFCFYQTRVKGLLKI